MEEILSCQLTCYPLETKDVSAKVKMVLEVIRNAPGIRSETNSLNTCVFGKTRAIFSLLDAVAAELGKDGSRYAMQVNISNYCGCDKN